MCDICDSGRIFSELVEPGTLAATRLMPCFIDEAMIWRREMKSRLSSPNLEKTRDQGAPVPCQDKWVALNGSLNTASMLPLSPLGK